MTREEAHKLIDQLFDTEPSTTPEVVEERKLPEGQRVVRTKSSGDKVYLLDDNKNTRAWVTNGDVLTALGFTLNDVGEVSDTDMMKYAMSAAIYKAPESPSGTA